MTARFLLVQLADMGDLILTTPAIAALRAAHPDAHITLLVAERAVAVMEPGLVDEVIHFERRGFNSSLAMLRPVNLRRLWSLRQHNINTVIFFHHFTLFTGLVKFALIALFAGAQHILGLQNGRAFFLTDSIPDEGFGVKHQAQYWLDLVALTGADNSPQRSRIGFDRAPLPLAMTRGKRIVIHPGGGAFSTARRWMPQRFAQVADALIDEFDAQIVLVGTQQDNTAIVRQHMRHTPVDLTDKTGLTGLADVLRSADLFIGSDSGVTHLAAAVRTPTVAIFGPGNHAAWSPWSPGGQVAIVRSNPECSPCSYVAHSVGLRDGCPARTCLQMVTVEQVMTTARALLTDALPPPTLANPVAHRVTDRVNILGIPVDNITYRRWLNQTGRWVQQSDRAHHVCTVNPEFIIVAQRDANFRHILQRADLCLPDGVGLLWAAHWLRNPLPERVTGSDGTVKIAEEAAKQGWRVFLLGAAPGVADQAAAILQERFPGLQIAGTYSGSPAPEEEDAIVARVNASHADILLVAYGAPQQDKWIARNLPRLNVSMAMGIGGSLDFIAGVVPRAPEWMQQYGLEWLFRLYKQPWRIIRMLRLPRFVILVLIRGSH